jgi:hypothetical protein
MKTAEDAEELQIVGVEHDDRVPADAAQGPYSSINHSFFAGSGMEARLLFHQQRNSMTRENWQALLFGLILLALCFVQ